MHRSVPNASKVLFRANEEDDEDMFAIDQSPVKKGESDVKSPDLYVGRVRNYCDEPLLIRILKPAAKMRFFLLSGKTELDKPEELIIGGADGVGIDLEKKVRWPRIKER